MVSARTIAFLIGGVAGLGALIYFVRAAPPVAVGAEITQVKIERG